MSDEHPAILGAGVVLVPSKKPPEQHKLPLSVTINPSRRLWLKQNFAELGFRSESHAVDEAIGLLMKTAAETKAVQPSNRSRSDRSRTSYEKDC